MSYHDIEPAELAEITALPGLNIIDQRNQASRNKGGLPGEVAPDDASIARLVSQSR